MSTPTDLVAIWLDFETTGLNVQRDAILEIGALATRVPNVEDELGIFEIRVQQPLIEMSEVVRDMHEKTGLLDAIDAGGATQSSAFLAFRAWIDRMAELAGPDASFILAGSGAARFDLAWLRDHVYDLGGEPLPELWYYRVLDVSEAIEVLHTAGVLDRSSFRPAETAHRALADATWARNTYARLRDEVHWAAPADA